MMKNLSALIVPNPPQRQAEAPARLPHNVVALVVRDVADTAVPLIPVPDILVAERLSNLLVIIFHKSSGYAHNTP